MQIQEFWLRELEIGQAKVSTFEKLVGQKFSPNLCLREKKYFLLIVYVMTYKTLDVSVDIQIDSNYGDDKDITNTL